MPFKFLYIDPINSENSIDLHGQKWQQWEAVFELEDEEGTSFEQSMPVLTPWCGNKSNGRWKALAHLKRGIKDTYEIRVNTARFEQDIDGDCFFTENSPDEIPDDEIVQFIKRCEPDREHIPVNQLYILALYKYVYYKNLWWSSRFTGNGIAFSAGKIGTLEELYQWLQEP